MSETIHHRDEDRPADASPGSGGDADLDQLLSDAADVLTADFDPAAARKRLDAIIRRQRSQARALLMITPAMLVGIVLVGPLLLDWAGVDHSGQGRTPALVGGLGFVAISLAWWWWTRHRIERALATGPPAIRQVVDDIGREARSGHRVRIACGLIAGPAMLLVAWESLRGGAAWWWVLWLALLGGWLLTWSARDAVHRIRTDHQLRREAKAGERRQ